MQLGHLSFSHACLCTRQPPSRLNPQLYWKNEADCKKGVESIQTILDNQTYHDHVECIEKSEWVDGYYLGEKDGKCPVPEINAVFDGEMHYCDDDGIVSRVCVCARCVWRAVCTKSLSLLFFLK